MAEAVASSGWGEGEGLGFPGRAWAAGRQARRLGGSAGEAGRSRPRRRARAAPDSRPAASPARPLPLPPLRPCSPATQGVGPWGLGPGPAPTPRPRPWTRPPRRSRGLTGQGEHRVVHFAAHHARALCDAVHPQPLVHGLGGDDVVAGVRAHLPLRDGGARHQAHPAQQSHRKAQQLQARIGHFRPQKRREAPGWRVLSPKEAKKFLVECLQILSPK